MSSTLDLLLVVLLVLNIFVLGSSRIRALVQAVALQGWVLGVMPLLVHEKLAWRVGLICVLTVAVKGLFIPTMLFRAMRQLPIKREVEPMVGLISSMVLGAVGTGLAMAFAGNLPLASGHLGSLLVPTALSTVLTGFLILTTRIKAITQVVGYLILENGIFIFGLLLLEPLPMMVEVGVLLDMLVGIFVMGIIISHIHREFESVSTKELAALKE